MESFMPYLIKLKIQDIQCLFVTYSIIQNIISQVRSMDSAIICNTTQENIHKYRLKKFYNKNKEE